MESDGLFYRNLNEEFAPEYIIEKKEKTLYSNGTYSIHHVPCFLMLILLMTATKECQLNSGNK